MEKIESKVAVTATPDWYDLLEQAVQEPGEMATAFKFFKKYSLANRWLASTQLRAAGLPLSPINTFKGWLGANRPVQKGQKASVALIMPVPVKGKDKDLEGKDKVLFTKFMLRSYWFHLGQTDGDDYVPAEVNAVDWNLESALTFLEIKDVPYVFVSICDTKSGRAIGREISVSPLESNPVFGRLREMARVLLGHTSDTPSKSVPTDTDVQDIEAETTAYLVAATLGLPGMEEARGRLQFLLGNESKMRIPDKCAHRAFSSADKIINAGFC